MLLALFALAADASIEGRWRNPSGRVVVQIAACGTAMCGSVVSAAESAKADARRGGTANLIGTQLMSGFRPDGPNKWRGRMFVPDINHRSKAELHMMRSDRLKVTGCMIGRMICKSQIWTRVD